MDFINDVLNMREAASRKSQWIIEKVGESENVNNKEAPIISCIIENEVIIACKNYIH